MQKDRKRLPSTDHELRMLQRAQMLGLPAPTPLGIMSFKGDGPEFLLMKFVGGESGVDFYERLRKMGNSPAETERKIDVVCKKLRQLAEKFRTKMSVDKRWYVKDCLIHFDDDGEIADVFPLDWELAHAYDPANPEEIDTLEIILARRERQAKRARAAADAVRV